MRPEDAVHYAVAAAKMSPCAKSKRGVVIFDSEGVIETGFNAPAAGVCGGTDECRAACNKICVHAEMDALRHAEHCYADGHLGELGCLDLLHIKVVDGLPVPSGPPSCWQCSRMILYSGLIERVWLLHDAGWSAYSAAEFHRQTLRTCGLPLFEAP